MTVDVVVLGAGIIGVSIALQLARRNKSVVLLDRRNPGEETSFGNAGLIQREGVVPYGFPQDIRKILSYSLNNNLDVHYHLVALPKVASFLTRYWWNSNPKRHAAISKAYEPLIAHSVTEHKTLIDEAGADDLIVKNGWVELYRGNAKRDEDYAEAERLSREFGIQHEKFDSRELALLEPDLRQVFVGALKWSDPWSVKDPLALTKAYVALFEKLGGKVVQGDALTLSQTHNCWRVHSVDGAIEAKSAVLALGPWSDILTRALGYKFNLGVKRGYHMHYAADEGSRLNNWVIDAERGYLLAPMTNGIRLTTGAEFAMRDAPKSPIQVDRSEPVAREIFPLGARLDEQPWMGSRPCTTDMMPIIGKAPRHDDLWFAFGHAHHGLTLGPITGRVIAESILGERTVVPLDAYRAERFAP